MLKCTSLGLQRWHLQGPGTAKHMVGEHNTVCSSWDPSKWLRVCVHTRKRLIVGNFAYIKHVLVAMKDGILPEVCIPVS